MLTDEGVHPDFIFNFVDEKNGSHLFQGNTETI